MRPNKLREKLNAGEPTLATHIHTTWPSIVEALGHTGAYDYVEFVAEYGPFDLHDLDNLARAAELWDLGTMIKVDAENRAYVAQRAIGSGFGSVLFADVRDPDDARACVRCVRADAPGDEGTYGVAMRRIAYMSLWRHPRIRPSSARRGRGFDDRKAKCRRRSRGHALGKRGRDGPVGRGRLLYERRQGRPARRARNCRSRREGL